MSKIETRLEELGLQLPNCPKPVAEYIPGQIFLDRLVYISGQDCRKDGILLHEGKLGADVSIQEGVLCARQSVLNCLAALKNTIGDLDRVKKIVKILGFVASAPGFDQHPAVINGGSQLLIQLFGEDGRHARAAIGTSELPFNTPVEIEMIVELKQ